MYISSLTSAEKYRENSSLEKAEHCILEMAEGNMSAIAELYECTKAAVYGFSLSILKNRHDAEDAMQDTYVKIYLASKSYKPNGNPMPWIFTIARNLSLMKLRERQKSAEMPDESSISDYYEEISTSVEDRIVLDALMEYLSDDERQIIMLHAMMGFKHREIADLLDISISTVLSKYHRGIKKLRKRLEERL